MKVYVLAVSNSEGCCRPNVYDSKEKAVKGLKEAYESEIEEWVDEDGKLIEDGDYINPIEYCDIDIEGGWASVQYRDNHVDFSIYEEEVK